MSADRTISAWPGCDPSFTKEFMMRVLAVLAVSISILATGPALAGPPSPDAALAKLLACDFVDGSKARLRCFEAALAGVRESHPGAVALAEAEREEIARLAAAQEANEFGLTGRESDRNAFANAGSPAAQADKEERQARIEAKEIDRIESVSVAAGRNNTGRVFVVLESGQIWKQLKSDSTRPVLRSDGEGLPVTIRKGALGSFFVKIGESQAFRAERIK